jgi:hypothetical protein
MDGFGAGLLAAAFSNSLRDDRDAKVTYNITETAPGG